MVEKLFEMFTSLEGEPTSKAKYNTPAERKKYRKGPIEIVVL